MRRTVLAILLSVVLSLLLLGSAYSIALRSIAGFGDAAHHLFLFMDVGLVVWAGPLVILAVRRKSVGRRLTLLLAMAGVVVNFLTVTVVGLIQSGGAPEFMRWAAEAGAAFLVAVTIAALVSSRRHLRSDGHLAADTSAGDTPP